METKKQITQSHHLQAKLLSGVKKLSDSVGATLGPRGRNVLIKQKDKPPFITKDGVTVANHISLEDPTENAAAEIVRQASRRTNTEAGDGTTTSTVLAAAIYEESALLLQENSDISPVLLQRAIQKTTAELLNALSTHSKKLDSLEDIKHIATISGNNDSSIGEIITRAIDSVGPDGSVTIENSNTSETSLDLIEGFRFDSGYASSSFITDERKRLLQFNEPLFLVTDSKLETVDQILPSLEIAARESRPFIIVAEEIEGQALAALIMNSVRGNMKVAAIKAPGYGESRREIMSDIATSTGAKFFQRINGDSLERVQLTDFGSAKSIRSSNVSTTIVGGSGSPDDILKKIESLQVVISESDFATATELTKRLVRLQSGVAVIRVGGNSEVEVTEKRHRVEDSLEAVRSAQSEGIVPGGGFCFMKCVELLKDKTFIDGLQVAYAEAVSVALGRAFLRPIEKMAENAGVDPVTVVGSFNLSKEQGYDFLNLKKVLLYEKGIIDPYRVTRCSIKNATSVATSLLTTSVSVIET